MNNLTKGQKIIIISLLLVVIGLLCFLVLNKGSNHNVSGGGTVYDSGATKTVMIYIAGNDLETENYIATGDFGVVDPNKIDLSKINILMYTGGTKKWHNFVSNDENGIYLLKSNGFTKIESYEQKNMGSPDTLSSFLNYAYTNYPADSYDMIFYGHGSAIQGSTLDEITSDNLSLVEFATAFNDSPFKDKKLDVVIFRSCLNGTLEFATLFSNYAKYMVASEEVSLGYSLVSVFNFLNDIKSTDDGYTFGKRFIDGYVDFLNKTKAVVSESQITTYSMIDLSKVSTINDNLNEFAKKIDLNKDYTSIANIRGNLVQYGGDYLDFDTVDLYTMVENVSRVTGVDGSKVLNSISNAVVYNKTNEEGSKGLSIYFPYNGSEMARDLFVNRVYTSISSLKDYGNFITQFNQIKDSKKAYAFSFSKNDMTASSKSKEATLKLTGEQRAVYSRAAFLVFRRVKDHPDYYTPLLSSNNVTLKGDTLYSNIGNNLIKWYDVEDGIETAEYITVVEDVRGKMNSRTVLALLSSIEETDEILNTVNLEIVEDGTNLKFKSAKLQSRNEKVNGVYVNFEKAEYVSIITGRYKILNSKGKYTTDWESSPVIIGTEMKPSNVKLIHTGLSDGEEYYCLFTIRDINNNVYYSDLIKIGD